jgi:anti-sigma regulatory factor (Ser/Thr protein kinase)
MTRLFGSLLQRQHRIRESSAVGAARRDALRLAEQLGQDETTAGKVAVIATELGNNLTRHGGGGDLFLQAIPSDAGNSLEIIAIDRGPGMTDLQQCLRDGYSSGGTPGTGLGAVQRMATEFDIDSVPGKGTVVFARVGPPNTLRFGAVCSPKEGEIESGDTWRLAQDGLARYSLMVADGLGHGSLAATAANAAAESFTHAPFDPPQIQIERAHQALTGTRGAAVACAQWSATAAVAYAGIGNIAGRLATAESSRGLVSHNGTLGFQLRRVQQFDYPISNGTLLIMHSDGLSARWDLNDHQGLRRHHPALIAATLYRDHTRGRDDATILVVSL